MFGLTKKTAHPIKESSENKEVENITLETHSTNTLTSGNFGSDHRESFLNNSGNELNILKTDVPEWEKTFDWADDVSWSKVLISESENLRHTGTINRQKDSAMVILVRRLEHFPSVEIIQAVRQNIQKDITRLNSVKEAMQPTPGQKPDSNPILTQTNVELSSELNKIIIEQEAFEKKILSELEIINTLIDSIVNSGKPRSLIHALLEIYQFGITQKGVYHISTPPLELYEEEIEAVKEIEKAEEFKIDTDETPSSKPSNNLEENILETQEEISIKTTQDEDQVKTPKNKESKTGESIKQISDVINNDSKSQKNDDSSYFDYNFIFGPDKKSKK